MRNDIEKRLAALEASRKIADELKERAAQRDITQHIAPVYVPLHTKSVYVGLRYPIFQQFVKRINNS